MHSTPNYGYTCNAPGQNDRDIERLKDKADSHGERITRNEERIKCLSGRVHNLECAPCGKETPNCKPDSCGKALRRHLTDPDAHEELFDQKVDKKDGCRLICEDELQGIYGALDERYTQAEVDALLTGKANLGSVTVYKLPLSAETIIEKSYYWKNEFNEVTLSFDLKFAAPLLKYQEIGILPAGFRPIIQQDLPATLARPFSPTFVRIMTDGVIQIGDVSAEQSTLYFNLTFAAQ